MMMGRIEARNMQWIACRVKRKQVGGIRTVTVGGAFEAYRDRAGRLRKRRVTGTGSRVFLPEHLLRRAGFDVFLPVKQVWQRKNARSKEKHLVSHPLLVDWVFVGWPADRARWSDLMALDVVTGVMGTGGRPTYIAESEILGLMRTWGGGLVDPETFSAMRARARFSAGDRAVITAGPFCGHAVRLIDVGATASRGVVDLLGRGVTLSIDNGSLVAPTEVAGDGV